MYEICTFNFFLKKQRFLDSYYIVLYVYIQIFFIKIIFCNRKSYAILKYNPVFS